MEIQIEDTQRKQNGFTTITLLTTTKERLAELMPKSWTWDRILSELTEMWLNQSGKSLKNHQTRRTDS